jgi:predicted dehydrogenase
MNWGLIGCGVIGERRVAALPEGVRLTRCFDPNEARAQKIAGMTGAQICRSEDEVLNPQEISAVVIAAINSALVPVIQKAIAKSIHVLVEKPAARSHAELAQVRSSSAKIKIGFNHRFHPAFEDLVREIQSRPEDPIMFVRAQYGNGARLGFEREWRSKVELSGGGELLDQGVHVLDLASVLMPGLQVVSGYTKTHYWQMPVDDNAWAILADKNGATFTFHVSSSEWKNEFRFEVYTRQRKYQWLGLGRSYGPEKLIIYKMKPEMGPPEVEERNYPGDDLSWKKENTNFLRAIEKNQAINGGYEDALNCLKLVEDIYVKSSQIQGPTPNHPQWWKGH